VNNIVHLSYIFAASHLQPRGTQWTAYLPKPIHRRYAIRRHHLANIDEQAGLWRSAGLLTPTFGCLLEFWPGK